MIKELFLAIVLGSLLGFGLTGSYFALKPPKNNLTPSPSVTPVLTATSEPPGIISPTPTEPINSLKVSVDSPLNQSIVAASKIELRGSSGPDISLIIQTPTRTYQTNTDKNGSFTIEIDLESGANLIKITAIDSELNQADTALLITYSTAVI